MPTNTTQLDDLNSIETITPFEETLRKNGIPPLRVMEKAETMQMNIGLLCNLRCKHCHVDAGPDRKELMPREVMTQALRVMTELCIPKLDITGGAPELNPDLTWLVSEATRLNKDVTVRSNLTVLDDERYSHMPEFYAENKVTLICSLAYYSQKDSDRIRGDGVFQSSIKMLKRLNELGYGREGSGLMLNLVYNPGGAFLPGAQEGIEADYRRVLYDRHGISFNNLFAIGNFPVGRFLSFLKQSGNLERYMEKLSGAFNPSTVSGVMCRSQISLKHDGTVYDCDFNQALGLVRTPKNISECSASDLLGCEIAVANHCYACTAGSGSSCGGAVI
ncbi:MAG: arsenosugar biosynthesis radical SAM protein ArsS [Oscillospiraceae bacterium]|nr:arsenosugar biosynthesis radical SAM protein ArsS [Oscillospiraceae bacterium]